MARLSTDLASAPSFYGERCTVDYESWSWECSNAPAAGTVDVTFRGDGMYSSFHSGVDQQTYGRYSWRTTGTYRSTSAFASGTAFGVAVDGYGRLSKSQNTTISKEMYFAPRP